MTDVYAWGENEARRIVREVTASERERAKIGNTEGLPYATRNLRPYHRLPGQSGVPGQFHVVLETEGFDFTELHNPCSDSGLVSVTTTEEEKFTANEHAFFEGDVFEQELALGTMFAGVLHLVGGNHICVVGTKVDDGTALYIELEDCSGKRVEFEWLTTPEEEVPDGTRVAALYVRAKRKYVAVVVPCEGEE